MEFKKTHIEHTNNNNNKKKRNQTCGCKGGWGRGTRGRQSKGTNLQLHNKLSTRDVTYNMKTTANTAV